MSSITYSHIIGLRLNDAEDQALAYIAKTEGLPKSLILRRALHFSFREAVKCGSLPRKILAAVETQKEIIP